MKVDNPNAFRFLMQEDLYLIKGDVAPVVLPASEEFTVPVTPEPTVEIARLVEQETVIAEAIVVEEQPARAATPVAEPPVVISEPPVPSQTSTAPFNYLGNNNKNFVILLNYPGADVIAPPHLTALESMLKRKDMTLADVAILNVHPYAPVTLQQLSAAFSPAKLLIMGKDSLPQGIGNLPLNKPVQGKKTHVLYSFSFDEMMSSNDNKKAFWDQMKTL